MKTSSKTRKSSTTIDTQDVFLFGNEALVGFSTLAKEAHSSCQVNLNLFSLRRLKTVALGLEQMASQLEHTSLDEPSVVELEISYLTGQLLVAEAHLLEICTDFRLQKNRVENHIVDLRAGTPAISRLKKQLACHIRSMKKDADGVENDAEDMETIAEYSMTMAKLHALGARKNTIIQWDDTFGELVYLLRKTVSCDELILKYLTTMKREFFLPIFAFLEVVAEEGCDGEVLQSRVYKTVDQVTLQLNRLQGELEDLVPVLNDELSKIELDFATVSNSDKTDWCRNVTTCFGIGAPLT